MGFAQMSGTYTINGAQATGGTNYQTWSAAASALGSNGVSGPVTFNVMDGTYSETVNWPSSISGTSTTNTITFQSDASNTTNPEVTSSGTVFNMNSGALNNLTFKEIDIVSTGGYAIYVYANSSSYSYQNIAFEDCLIEAPDGGSSGTGPLYLYGYYGGQQTWSFDGCELTGGYYGIYFYAYYAATGSELVINDCEVTDFGYYGFYTYGYQSYPVIKFTNSYWENSSTAANGYPIYAYYVGAGSEISGNVIKQTHSNYSYGIYLRANGNSTTPVLFENNMINCTNANASGQYGMRFYYNYYLKVRHNTVRTTCTTNYAYPAYLYYNYSGNEFTNNILANEGAVGYSLYHYYYSTMSSAWTSFDYNAYSYGESDELYNYDGYSSTTASTLSSWQSGAGVDANSVAAEPVFYGNNDLHCLTPEYNNAGTNVGVTMDIDGETRSTTTPDIGADEFIVPANNSKIDELITPTAPLCTDDTTISIVLYNQGLVALTSCTINYCINGGTPVSQAWTGNIAPQSDTVVSVVSPINFSDGDVLTVYTTLPNGVMDSVTNGDTAGLELWEGLSGTYAIPADYATIADARDALATRGVCDDVIFNLAAGTYTESISFPEIDGVSADATVTFQSATGNLSDVTWESTAGYTVQLSGSDWVTFQNMRINNSSGNVFQLSGECDNITINNCWLKGTTGTSTTTQSLIYNNSTGDNFSITNSHLEKGSAWHYATGGSNTDLKDGLTITNNLIEDQTYYGSMNYYFDNVEIHNNVIKNDSAFQYGFGYYGGFYMYYCNNFNITGNYIGASAQNGFYYPMYFYQCVGSSNPRSVVANNCVVGANSTSTSGYNAVQIYYSGLIDFYNNSITRYGTSSTSYAALYVYQGGSINIMNNNLINMAGGYALYVNGAFAINSSDHNNFYTSNGSMFYYGSSLYNNLEDYQNATGNDMNSVNTDPDWQDLFGCVTCNDTIGNGGAVLSNVLYDIDSNMRSLVTPDIGAVEYVTGTAFTLGPDDTICGNSAVIEAGPAQSITWSINNQTYTDPSVTLTTSGEPVTYTISVNITTEYCGNGSDNAVIRLVPDATLDSTMHICADETADLDAGGSSTADFMWTTGATTKTITISEAGTYGVTKLEDGCESDAVIAVTQSDAVELVDVDACSDDVPVTLDATISNGTSYAWSGGSSINTAQNDFTDAGDYSVTATDSYGCTSSSDFTLSVLEEPTAKIDEDHSGNYYEFDGTVSEEIGSNTTYFWDLGYNGQTDSSAVAAILYPWSDPNNLTTYTVTLTVDNGCGVDVTTKDVTPDPTGIEELAAGSFTLYPNPAREAVNFVLSTTVTNEGNIAIMDVTGRVLNSQVLAAGQTNGEINLNGLSAGSYLVKLTIDGSSTVSTLIVQ